MFFRSIGERCDPTYYWSTSDTDQPYNHLLLINNLLNYISKSAHLKHRTVGQKFEVIMGERIYRSIREPIREHLSFAERWRGPDKGLITCWEVGRKLSESEPELAERAKRGELPVLGWRGYGLVNVCKKIGYEFNHHDALEDAKASAQVLLAAIEATGMDIESWLNRVQQPIALAKSNRRSPSGSPVIKREGNPEGVLYGEVVVFTGALEIPRNEAADWAASIGCSVAAGVTKKTTLLVVGDQDLSRLAGKKKSSKHLKTEQLIAKGQKIRILRESDFKELVNHAK